MSLFKISTIACRNLWATYYIFIKLPCYTIACPFSYLHWKCKTGQGCAYLLFTFYIAFPDYNLGGFICTFSLLISISHKFQSSKFNLSSSSQCNAVELEWQLKWLNVITSVVIWLDHKRDSTRKCLAFLVTHHIQGHHGRFFGRQGSHSGGHFAGLPLPLPQPLSYSKNLAKDQAFAALPPVVALISKYFELTVKWFLN